MLSRSSRRRRWLLSLVGVTLLLTATHSLRSTAKAQALDPSDVGEWSCCVTWPVNATYTVMLPTGNLLFWRTTDPYVWDPATETITPVTKPGHNIFCAGFAFFGNGKILVAGGAHPGVGGGFQPGGHDPGALGVDAATQGIKKASIYDPFSNSWTGLPLMADARWYPGVTTLPNGDALVTSGKIGGGQGYSQLHQVWQVASGTWRNLTGAIKTIPMYPWMFVAPNGRVFMAGPLPLTEYLSTAGTGNWSVVGSSNWGKRYYGGAVMYDEGKVLITGGFPIGPFPPTNTTEVIDLKAGATWRYVAPMAEPRTCLNTTLLPDGKVLVTGGHKGLGTNDPTAPVYLAEMWDPQTETWSSMASNSIYRGYHSTATLLPDGRVVSAGGDGVEPTGLDREIYSPPYLFKGPRPTIVSAPATVGHGQTFFVATPDAANITSVNLLANGSVTHAVDMGQRINRLTFTQAPGGLNVTAPANSNLCPPGPHMLFILTSAGVPSVAAHIMIG